MKYLLSLLVTCLSLVAANAQNLVPNPSFTLYSGCPSNFSCIDSCIGWHNATWGTPDYFHACDTSIYSDVPVNFFGNQTSNSNSYSGIFTFTKGLPEREYIRASIADLEPGATYKVSMVVSLADSAYYACDGLGIYFYNHLVTATSGELLVTPQVDFSDYGVIQEKANWVTLTTSFTADSAYKNLVIGNFKGDAATDTVIAPFPSSVTNVLYLSAYYYIDSVSVEKIPTGVFSHEKVTNNSSISPNPFTDYAILNFRNDPISEYTLNIYNIHGSIVRSTQGIKGNRIEIARDNLPGGFYYYMLYSSGNSICSGKFVIKQ